MYSCETDLLQGIKYVTFAAGGQRQFKKKKNLFSNISAKDLSLPFTYQIKLKTGV